MNSYIRIILRCRDCDEIHVGRQVDHPHHVGMYLEGSLQCPFCESWQCEDIPARVCITVPDGALFPYSEILL